MERGRFCILSPILYKDFLLLHEFLQLKETHTLLQVTRVILLDMSTSDAPEVADDITHVFGNYVCTLETRYLDFDSVFSKSLYERKNLVFLPAMWKLDYLQTTSLSVFLRWAGGILLPSAILYLRSTAKVTWIPCLRIVLILADCWSSLSVCKIRGLSNVFSPVCTARVLVVW